MGVDLGAMFGGASPVFFVFKFQKLGPFTGPDWAWIGLGMWARIGLWGAACFQKKCLRMGGKREGKFCASHNSQRHLGVGGLLYLYISTPPAHAAHLRGMQIFGFSDFSVRLRGLEG